MCSSDLRVLTRRTLNQRSTAFHSKATTSLGGTGSPSLLHASWPTQAEGWWSKNTVVSLMLCRMQAMMRHTAATPTWLPSCKTHVGPHAGRRKSKREFSTKNHPQNSSYKVQRLHAAVLMQSGSNRLRSLVADSVHALQNSCRPSRTATKKQTRIQH